MLGKEYREALCSHSVASPMESSYRTRVLIKAESFRYLQTFLSVSSHLQLSIIRRLIYKLLIIRDLCLSFLILVKPNILLLKLCCFYSVPSLLGCEYLLTARLQRPYD